jgi:hypothetical protein
MVLVVSLPSTKGEKKSALCDNVNAPKYTQTHAHVHAQNCAL